MSIASDAARSNSWQRAGTPTGSIADQIMDRIDRHMGGIGSEAHRVSSKPLSALDSYSVGALPTASSHALGLGFSDNHATHANDDAASTSTMQLLRNFTPGDVKNIEFESDLGTDLGDLVPSSTHHRVNFSSAEKSRVQLPEPDVDVSSVVAMQINEQYREVLNRKHVMNTYHQSDNETVRTEDFANKYRALQVQQATKAPANGHDAQNIIERANTIIDRYKYASSAPAPRPLLSTGNTATSIVKSSAATASRTQTSVNVNSHAQANAHAHSQLPWRNYKALSPLVSGGQSPAEVASPIEPSKSARKSAPLQSAGAAGLSLGMTLQPQGQINRSEIKKESERIKSELEVERRNKMLQDANARKELISIIHPSKQTNNQSSGRSENEIARERLHVKLSELEELNSEIKRLRVDRDRVTDEVDRMNDLLKRQQEEIRFSERTSKASRSRSDELKHETTVLQAKRDATVLELEQLSSELSERRSKLLELENKLNDSIRELHDYQSLGLSREEVQKIIAERNDLFQLVSKIEEREMEKYELEKRLTVAQEDRLIEQEQFKERVTDLEDELQTRVSQLEDFQKENQAMKEEIRNLRTRLSELQRERDNTLQEKASEQERMRQQMHRDLNEIQKSSTDEIVSIKSQMIDLRKQIAQLEKEIDRRNESIGALNAEKGELQLKLKLEKEETERKLRDVELVKNNDSKKLYDQLRKERESALTELEDRLQAERQRAITKIENKHSEELKAHSETLADAEKEIGMLKEKIGMLESNCDELHAYYSKELDEKLKHSLERERKKFEAEMNLASQKAEDEIMRAKLEREKVLQTLSDELVAVRKTLGEKEGEIRRFAEELEKQKEKYRVSLLEKQNELLKVKAEVRETCQSELSKIRNSMKKDFDSDKAKLQTAVAEYRIRFEQAQLQIENLNDARNTLAEQQCEWLRGIVEEVNADCQTLAQAVCVTPKLTSADDIQLDNDNKAVIKTALATLKACCEEVRDRMTESIRESETLKDQLAAAEAACSDETAKLKVVLEAQHTKEINQIRERLSKQHAEQLKELTLEHNIALQNTVRMREDEMESSKLSMEGWKQETAQKLASSIQSDLRNEYDRKVRELKQELRSKEQELINTRSEIDRLTSIKQMAGTQDESATRVIGTLQERLKQLREQNIELHRMLSAKRIGVSNDLRLHDAAPLGSNAMGYHAMSTASSAGFRQFDREYAQNGASSAAARQLNLSPIQPMSSVRPQSASSAANVISSADRNNTNRSQAQQQANAGEGMVPQLNLGNEGVDDLDRFKDKNLRCCV